MDAKKALGLPNAVKGMTYSDAAKYIDNLFKGRHDFASNNTKDALLGRLMNAQEIEREKVIEQERAEQQEMQQQQLKYGGLEGEPRDDVVQPMTSREVDMSTPKQEAEDRIRSDESSILDQVETQDEPGFFKKAGSFINKNSGAILQGLGLAASVLGPMIANKQAMDSISPAQTVQPGRIAASTYKENLVNRQQLSRMLANQSATSRQALRQTGANLGQLQAGYSGIHNATSNALANVLLQADMADTGEKARVQQGKAAIQSANIQQSTSAAEKTAMNQAAYESQMAAYKQAQGANIGSIGTTLFNYVLAKDYAKYAGQAAKFQTI